MNIDKTQLITGVALGVLATLAAGKLFPPQEPPRPEMQQPDLRLLQGRLYGMTPDQLDMYNPAAQTGYLPQHRDAVLAAFMSLPRPARAEILNRMAQRGMYSNV
jgi:hypothetical protein